MSGKATARLIFSKSESALRTVASAIGAKLFSFERWARIKFFVPCDARNFENSAHVYLLVDSSKYGRSSLLTYAGITDMEKIIVDDEADKAFVELCKQNNVELQLVKVEME